MQESKKRKQQIEVRKGFVARHAGIVTKNDLRL